MRTHDAPFKITEWDTEHSPLDHTDIGKWGLVVRGCYHTFETEQEAQECADNLTQEN